MTALPQGDLSHDGGILRVATSGTVLLAVGFVLLLKRELWVRWQTRAATWWRGWGAADLDAPPAGTTARQA